MAPKKSSVSDMFKAKREAGSGKAKGGSKVPTSGSDPLHDQVHNAYVALKDAQATFDGLEGMLLERINALYAQNARDGRFSKSYNLAGIETSGVQVSYKDQFVAVSAENESKLRDNLGDDFDRYFQEKRELQLVDTSDANVELLIKKLGEETFNRLFDLKSKITVCKDMDREQFNLDDETRSMIKQYKPSIKIAK